MTDFTKLLDRLEPPQDGESPVRHRTGTVNAVNSDGTVDLDLGGIVVDSVAVLAGAFIAAGTTVQVAVWRGDLLVLGAVRTANQGGPLGVLGYAEVTANQTGITTETDLTGLSTTVDVPTNRRIKIRADTAVSSSAADDRIRIRIKEGTTVLQFRDLIVADTLGTNALPVEVVLTPSAGSHTYKVSQERASGSGSTILVAGPSNPVFLIITGIGPA